MAKKQNNCWLLTEKGRKTNIKGKDGGLHCASLSLSSFTLNRRFSWASCHFGFPLKLARQGVSFRQQRQGGNPTVGGLIKVVWSERVLLRLLFYTVIVQQHFYCSKMSSSMLLEDLKSSDKPDEIHYLPPSVFSIYTGVSSGSEGWTFWTHFKYLLPCESFWLG